VLVERLDTVAERINTQPYCQSHIHVLGTEWTDSRELFFLRRVVDVGQEMVDEPRIGAFRGRLDKLRQQGWALSWTKPLSPRPHGIIGSPVRPYKVRYKVGTSICRRDVSL